jgi:predicted O-methyltransferase YrrM
MSWDLFVPFETMKKEGKWPIPWTSAMGLIDTIKNLGDDVVGCEIGSNFGINIVYFLDNLPNIKKIIAIDPYVSYDDRITGGEIVPQETMDRVLKSFLVNIEAYKDRVEFIHDNADNSFEKIADGSLDYIFIDGDHNYEAVIKDMKNYYSKVRDGGIFAGHDVGSPGVQKAISEFIQEYKIDTKTIKFCDHQTWYWIKNSKADESNDFIKFTTH